MKKLLLLISLLFISLPASATEKKESVYDRVIRTGEIKCGYAIWPPYIDKDIETGELSGIFYDYVNELGKTLELKVKWTEETSYASYNAGLNTNRFDAMCAGVWPVGAVMKSTDFSNPPYYHPIGVYVRKDDNRFDKDFFNITNNPEIRIANIDGFIPGIIAKAHFPKSKIVSLPELSGIPFMLMNIAQNKADMTFTDPYAASRFMKSNPDTIKEVELSTPIRSYGNTIAVRKGEQEFLNMLNYANEELVSSGRIKDILKKYPEVSPFIIMAKSRAE